MDLHDMARFDECERRPWASAVKSFDGAWKG